MLTRLVAAEGGVELWREVEGGHEVWKASFPVLGTAHKSEKEPRYPSLPGIMKAKKKEIPERPVGSLGADLGGPRLEIFALETPPARGGGKILKDGDMKAVAGRRAWAGPTRRIARAWLPTAARSRSSARCTQGRSARSCGSRCPRCCRSGPAPSRSRRTPRRPR